MIVSSSKDCEAIEKMLAPIPKSVKDWIKTASLKAFEGLEIVLNDNYSETTRVFVYGKIHSIESQHGENGSFCIDVVTFVGTELWKWKIFPERVRGFVIMHTTDEVAVME